MRRILLLVGLLLIVLGSVPFLPYALERRDPLPGDADAIYVLPGKLETRARCAARLFEQSSAVSDSASAVRRRGSAPLVAVFGFAAAVCASNAIVGPQLRPAAEAQTRRSWPVQHHNEHIACMS